MSDPFNLDESRFYNAAKCSLALDAMIGDAEVLAKRIPLLARFEYEPLVGKLLAELEEKITAALDTVTAAREEYEQKRIRAVTVIPIRQAK